MCRPRSLTMYNDEIFIGLKNQHYDTTLAADSYLLAQTSAFKHFLHGATDFLVLVVITRRITKVSDSSGILRLRLRYRRQ